MGDATAAQATPGRLPATPPSGGLRRTAMRWALPQAVPAVVIGAAWWLLAPGGRRVSDDGYLPTVEAVGSQDAWFAVLVLAAGVTVALLWVARRGGTVDTGSVAALVGAVTGAMLGGLLAWVTGSAVDTLTASDVAGGSTAVTDLGLRVPAVLLLWPLAVVSLVLVDTAREMAVTWARERPEREAERRRLDAAEVDQLTR